MLKLSHSSFQQKKGFQFYEFLKGAGGFLEQYTWVRLVWQWLLATVEALTQGEGLKEFVKSTRVDNKAFIAQRC